MDQITRRPARPRDRRSTHSPIASGALSGLLCPFDWMVRCSELVIRKHNFVISVTVLVYDHILFARIIHHHHRDTGLFLYFTQFCVNGTVNY